ncbi:hypothetical protein M758_3G136200 [Ceratodon purpureus]|nr:hypothetical protein M758_3G136200 [Ceratodon purpureus]
MPIARPDSGETRVIAHLDLDCFYVQVEQRKRPELRGKPVAVVQFNPWKGGGLIAVSYEARKCGVLRCMRGDDAKKVCPDIELVQVPMAHGHADVSIYRDAGTEVYEVLSRAGVCERASIDEVYLDLTEAAAARLLKNPPKFESLPEEALKTHILGLPQEGENAMTVGEWLCQSDSPRCDALLACGAVIVAELRTAVLAETQFTCSAGIGHNKMLAKVTSAMHKPAQQTVIPASYVPALLATLPLKKIGHLGGKLGKSLVEDLGVKTPSDLLQFSQLKLQELYGVNTGTWLWNIARGKNGDQVKTGVLAKSHSAGKTFAGRTALTSMDSLMHWIGEMCEELQEKLDSDLETHNRKAKLLVFHATVHLRGGPQPTKKFPSKSCPIRYGKEKLLADARILFERGLRDFYPANRSLSPVKGSSSNKCDWAVTAISIGAGGMMTIPTGVNPITSFFAAPARSSLQKPSLSLSPPASPVSAPDLDRGQHRVEHCERTEESEMGSSSRVSSSNDLEGMATSFCDGIENDEGSGVFKLGSLVEPASCRNLFLSDDLGNSDADVNCTPTFGSIGSPVRQRSHLQIRLEGGNSVLDACTRSDGNASPCEDLEPTVIQCSPVEDSFPVISNSESFYNNTCSVANINSQQVDSKPEVSSTSDVTILREADQKATRVVQPRLGFLPSKALAETPSAPGTAKSTAALKLKDLWQRNLATQTQSGLKRASNNWEYKQDEIDDEVLAQLPVEIQKEIRDSLKLNRPVRPAKRPSISNFFLSSK